MKISVCIPAYNRPATIRKAIHSVLAQTERDWELVITDDSATSAVEQVVASFYDQRIHYTRNSHRLGLEGNWNTCLTRARGECIKLLMDDDFLHPNCLQEQVAMLQANPKVALVSANYDVVNDQGQPITVPGLGSNPYRLFKKNTIEPGHVFIQRYLCGQHRVGLPSSMLMRSSSLHLAGLVDPEAGVSADADLWLRLCLQGDFAYYDAKLLAMRWHQTNLSKTLESGPGGYKSILRLYERWLQRNDAWLKRYRSGIALQAAIRIVPYFRQAKSKDKVKILKDIQSLPLSPTGKLRVHWWLNRP